MNYDYNYLGIKDIKIKQNTNPSIYNSTFPKLSFLLEKSNSELITGPVFTAKGRIRPFLGYSGRFWPVFGS